MFYALKKIIKGDKITDSERIDLLKYKFIEYKNNSSIDVKWISMEYDITTLWKEFIDNNEVISL